MGELGKIRGNLESFERVSAWVHEYLARPHPELGRSGPVCPFAPVSLHRDAIRISIVRMEHGKSFELVKQSVLDHQKVFLSLENSGGEDRIYNALLIVFPDVTLNEAGDLIDAVQSSLKPLFVKEGLMLGEFHERNRTPGLHNSAFHPLVSPVPMLVIRWMVPSDIVFLSNPKDSVSRRRDYLDAYLRFQGAALSPRERESLERLSAEISSSPNHDPR